MSGITEQPPEQPVYKITDQLRQEIEALDPGASYEERICMQAVSKDLTGAFVAAELQEEQSCETPECVTLKGWVTFEIQVATHKECDSELSQEFFDGPIGGKMVFAYIDDGHGRGYHLGDFQWDGSQSVLRGRMFGVTNAGTHREPAAPCEPCDRRGHMEGRLDAVVYSGEHEGCRVLATYVIDFDAGLRVQRTDLHGTLEGVSICPCEG